jgi:CRISPR-associated endonuclease Cas2
MLVIIAYDIYDSSNRMKVINKINKICKKYLYQLQYSVFFGELDKKLYNQLTDEISRIIDTNIDSVISIVARNKNNVNLRFHTRNKSIDNIIF